MSTKFKQPIAKVLKQLGFEPFNDDNLFLRAEQDSKVLYAERSMCNVVISDVGGEILTFNDSGVTESDFALMLLAKDIIKLDQFHTLQNRYSLQLNLLKQAV